MQSLNLKPTHKLVKNYYEVLGQFGQLNIDHEMAVRSAFQTLLAGCGRQFEWTLVPEYSYKPVKLNPVRVDGALLDTFRLTRGFWEAKDEHDALEKEIKAKFEKGYPRNNIIFQAPERAILFQNGVRQGLNEDLRDAENLVELLKHFFGYREPQHEEWDEAVADFKGYIPKIAEAVKEKIDAQRLTNSEFVKRFDDFYALCREAINPNLSVDAVETMLIQHLLTERIFRKIFDNPDFTRRNVIAVEIEKVIDSMTRKEFSRDAFLKELDRFYRAIEKAAESTSDYSEKQHFLNSVYERFFQGYSPKEADTHGIVYTPQPIVDFMVRSVEDILKKEFGRSLSDKGVHILDPFVGTGNFITRVMKEIKTSALPYKFENELHCNEVMLLPYYVASMNIEHEYMERTGEYKPFPGICLVDTFELAEPEQAGLSFMTEENTERVRRQKEAPIFVIIGNPPYNAGQANENDNNKNRKYPELDRRVNSSYAKRSLARNMVSLSDPYVKAIKWATDRIGQEGLIAYVSNYSYVHELSMDGVRAAAPLGMTIPERLRSPLRMTIPERLRSPLRMTIQERLRAPLGMTK
jgi:predicted helicase